MWTKVQFEKDIDNSTKSSTLGYVTAVWNESQKDEVIYEEYITIETGIVAFCQHANATKNKVLTAQTDDAQVLVDQVDLSAQILAALNT